MPELNAQDTAMVSYLEQIQQSKLPSGPDFPRYRVTECTPKYIILQCDCGRHIVPSTCMNLRCKNCADFIRDRRKWKVYFRLNQSNITGHGRRVILPVLYTVLTLPEEIRYLYTTKEAWSKLRRKAWSLLKTQFHGWYGVEATHPVGDEDEKHFHPHLNFLWKVKPGFRPFLDVNKLRQAWSKILGVPNADIYHQYSVSTPQIIHWVKYVCRTFPGAHHWTGSLRWFGKYPKAQHDKRNCQCPDCGKTYKYIGWLFAADVEDWYAYGQPAGTDPPWLRGDFKI